MTRKRILKAKGLIFKSQTRKVESMLQQIRTQGWTSETIRRAVEGLASGDEISAEFVRWFLNVCNVDIDDVVDMVNGWKPVSPTTPHLDALYAILIGAPAISDVVVALKERYPEPEKRLIALLDEVFPDDGAEQAESTSDIPERSHELAGAHRLAFAGLLLLGTSESTDYVLRQLHHFDWSDASLDRTRAEVFQSCGEAIRAGMFRLWPALSWSRRAKALGFLHAHDLHNDRMLMMLMEVEFEALSHVDLTEYIKGLWNLYDRRAMSQVRKIADRALGDAQLGSTDAKAVVDIMFEFFGDSSWLTTEQVDWMGAVLVSKRRIGMIRIDKSPRERWTAQGPVPLAAAQELYEDAVGQRDIWVNGDSGRPTPENQAIWYTVNGALVLPTKELSVTRRSSEPVVFHDDPATIASGFVLYYTIHSEAGLELFQAVLRKHGIDRAPPPSWW